MKRDQLIEARKKARLTQAEIATKARIQRSYYGLIETGQRNPSLEIATRIADALNTSIEQAFPKDIFFGNRSYIMKQE